MSPLVGIFKDVHIKIMTSQPQPAQGAGFIRKSFFTAPFQPCSEAPRGAKGGCDTHTERVWVTQLGDAAPSSVLGLLWQWG